MVILGKALLQLIELQAEWTVVFLSHHLYWRILDIQTWVSGTCFLRNEWRYWSELPFPPPGDLPNPGIKPTSPALAGRFFSAELLGKAFCVFGLGNLIAHVDLVIKVRFCFLSFLLCFRTCVFQFRLCFRGTIILSDLGLQTRQTEREQSQAETQGREIWCGRRGLLW